MAKKKRKLDEEKAEMDMSPMIDCVFLLLIFFIVVSTQAEVQTDPKVKPTIADHSKLQESALGRIVINAYYQDGSKTEAKYTREDRKEITDLGVYMEAEKKRLNNLRPGEPLIIHLRCTRSLNYKFVQQVQEKAAALGITDFTFASYQIQPKGK